MIAAACLAAAPVVVDGSPRMRNRPIAEGVELLRRLGAEVAKVEPPQVEKEPEEEVEEEVEGEVPEGEVPEGEEGAPKDEEGAEPAAEDRKEGKR